MVTQRSSGSRADLMRTSFNTYLDEFCTEVTLDRKVETYDSQDRVIGVTTISSTIKADIQFVTKQDLLHLNIGEVQIGDGMLFVKWNSNIQIHDEVVFNSVTWRVTSKIEGELVNGQETYKGYIIKKNE